MNNKTLNEKLIMYTTRIRQKTLINIHSITHSLYTKVAILFYYSSMKYE